MMLVEQIWTGNAYRNFNYLIACSETGEALAIDPLDHRKCLDAAKSKGWEITQVLNTHEHGDHTGGNGPVIEATGAKLLAHHNAGPRIDGIDVGLSAGDTVGVGRSVELLALDTPGHTMSHICLLSKTDQPALFSGDTLFNAGAGNCHGGGHPKELYETFVQQLDKLADDTLVYPGTTTSPTTSPSRWTGNPTTRPPPISWRSWKEPMIREARWSPRSPRRRSSTPSSASRAPP